MEQQNRDKTFAEVMAQLPPWFTAWSKLLPWELQEGVTELRLFCGQVPLWIVGGAQYRYGRECLSSQNMQELFLAVCQGSVHSFQEEIREGFVTLRGGHRVGLCGTAVFHNGQQSGLRDITSLNIRFARQHKGCAGLLYQALMEWRLEKGSFLLTGPPGSGKTSLLRDYCRILSNKGTICAVLDERGELSDFYMGPCTHVLKSLPKSRAILQALRCLAPEVILCDEIGTVEEAKLLCEALNSGSKFIATIHGEDLQQLLTKPQMKPLLEQQALDALVLVEPMGKIKDIMEVKKHAFSGVQSDFSQWSAGRLLCQVETGTGFETMEGSAVFSSADCDGAADKPLQQSGNVR